MPKERVKKKKKSKNNYFNEGTEKAIIAFNSSDSEEERQNIYVAEIQPAFLKLVENTIFVYKFHKLGNVGVLKNDCLSFLYECLPKFDASRGKKAFSYFNIVAKNWFIQRLKIHKKKSQSNIRYDPSVASHLESTGQAVVPSPEDEIIDYEFLIELKDEIKKWRSKYTKTQERTVLEAVIVLLENPDLLPLYNKKGIYLYLREITGYNTKQVVTNLTKFKKRYEIFKRRYYNGDI